MNIKKQPGVINTKAFIKHSGKKAKIIGDMVSLGIAGVSGYAGSQFNPTSKAMDLIVEQFVQSGAESTYAEGNTIFPVGWDTGDLTPDMSELINQLDFTSVTDIYKNAANLGMIVGSAGIAGGLAMRLIGKKKQNTLLEGTGKTVSRASGAYGLIKVLAAKIGLGSMPYTIQISPENIFSLANYSAQNDVSSVDLGPIIQNANNLMNIELIALGSYLTGDAIATGIEYARNKPSKAIKKLAKNRY
ncbi:MAG: hypothetical protein WC307_04065 [Candidatus Nanoarchaeia archaeon]|jgi:hypothetical protein